MSEPTVQVLHNKIGRPHKRPKDRRRHPLGLRGTDFHVDCIRAIMQYRLEQEGELPSRQDAVLWSIERVAKSLGIGPFAENGNDK